MMGYYTTAPVESTKARNVRLRQERIQAARAKGTHTKDEWREMYEASGPSCVRCGFVGHVCKDHIVPIYLGGSDSIRNLQPMCRNCNSEKGPDSTDFRIGKPWMRPEWHQGGE